MKRVIIIAVTITVLLGAAGGVYAFMSHHRDDAGEPIRINVGDTYEVRLAANMTTGYSWSASYNDAVLELVDDRYESPATSAVGAGGTQVLVFKALAAGTAKVVLNYQRPWEGEPIESREIIIEVREG